MHEDRLYGPAMVEVARRIAGWAHTGQVDKGGQPYVRHPERVAAGAGSDDLRAVAWLHDVLEDSPLEARDLRLAGFPDHVVAAVEALTRRPGEDYDAQVGRALADPLARAVKRADLEDNADPARLAAVEARGRYGRARDWRAVQRLRAKYVHGRRLLDLSDGAVLVVDDARTFPHLDAIYLRSSQTAIAHLATLRDTATRIAELWVDHDLGPDDDVMPLLRWLQARYAEDSAPAIDAIVIPTTSPVGFREVEQVLDGAVPLHRLDVRDLAATPPSRPAGIPYGGPATTGA